MKTLIFGCGYTGRRLKELIPEAMATELPSLCTNELIPFDFNDTDTWKNIPKFDQAVITFKMTNESLAKQFAKFLKGKKVILLSSAGNLQNSSPDEIISEDNKLKECPRAKAESHFKNLAAIMHLGLIWGPERMPEKWISAGRIKNGNKFINFINVDDLCKIIIYFLNNSDTKEPILVSDGQAQRWNEVAIVHGVKLKEAATGLESRRFNTGKLQKSLPENFEFKKPY